MKLSKQQLKTSTRHYIKKCAGAVCTSKLHESARNSKRQPSQSVPIKYTPPINDRTHYLLSKRRNKN